MSLLKVMLVIDWYFLWKKAARTFQCSVPVVLTVWPKSPYSLPVGPQGQSYFPSDTKTLPAFFTVILWWGSCGVSRGYMWSHHRLKTETDLRLQAWQRWKTTASLLTVFFILEKEMWFFIRILACNGFIVLLTNEYLSRSVVISRVLPKWNDVVCSLWGPAVFSIIPWRFIRLCIAIIIHSLFYCWELFCNTEVPWLSTQTVKDACVVSSWGPSQIKMYRFTWEHKFSFLWNKRNSSCTFVL